MCTPLTGSPELAITFPMMTVWASRDVERNKNMIATNLAMGTRVVIPKFHKCNKQIP